MLPWFGTSLNEFKFHVRIRDNAVSKRLGRCGIIVMTFTGDNNA